MSQMSVRPETLVSNYVRVSGPNYSLSPVLSTNGSKCFSHHIHLPLVMMASSSPSMKASPGQLASGSSCSGPPLWGRFGGAGVSGGRNNGVRGCPRGRNIGVRGCPRGRNFGAQGKKSVRETLFCPPLVQLTQLLRERGRCRREDSSRVVGLLQTSARL